MQMREPRAFGLGYVYVILAAGLWALSGTAAKYLFQGGMSPFELVQLRTTIAAAMLLVWLLAGKRGLLRVARKDYLYLPLLGITLAAMQFTYLYSISRIQVAVAVLLQYQAPVLIAAYALLFDKRRPSLVTLVSLFGAVVGCYLMVGAYNLNLLHMNSSGIISGLGSAIAFALYSVRSEYGMRTYAPWTVLFYALLFAAVIWNVLHPPFSAFHTHYGAFAWRWVLFIGLFGTVLPFGLYNEGIKRISSTRASITATLEPVAAGGIAYGFLGEMMEPWQVVGAGLVIASALLLQVEQDPAGQRNVKND
jgi:drug/metabolite transporter (DMT)-like permease